MEGTGEIVSSSRARKARIRLTPQQREQLEQITGDGATKSKRFVHARALLMADEGHPAGRYADRQVGRAPGVAAKTVARVRAPRSCGAGSRWPSNASGACRRRSSRSSTGRPRRRWWAICCSPAPAPAGQARWTLRLLTEELVGRKVVSPASARRRRARR